MKNIEEYLYYHENQDYINLKFLSCTYYQNEKRLAVRYIYNADIEEYLPSLQKRLEELFMRQVGLPIKYDFIYQKVFVDALSLQLEIVSFLRKKYGALSKQTNEDSVTVSLDGHIGQVKLALPANLIEFLKNSLQWQKFQQELTNRNFYDFEFTYQAI
ncbi:MAG: hypothetical protein MJ054_00580 [Clostridia bacterium]|nr:hypothetical protein [Clostridia bacterium]